MSRIGFFHCRTALNIKLWLTDRATDRQTDIQISITVLNLAELNLHPSLCPDIAYFCADRGRYSPNQPTSHHRHYLLLLNQNSFTVPQRVEDWVVLGTAVNVCSPNPPLHTTVAALKTIFHRMWRNISICKLAYSEFLMFKLREVNTRCIIALPGGLLDI